MKLQLTILGLAVLALAKPQAPPDPAPAPAPAPSSTSEPPPPPADPPAPPSQPPAPAPAPAPPSQPPAPPPSDPAPVPPPPSDPAPVPPPSDPAPVPPPASPAPPPPSNPPPAPPAPKPTGTPPEGPICECGYTYCASVLQSMDKPWSDGQLANGYCKTPNAVCNQGTPSSNLEAALFICLCAEPDQKVGDHIELLCGCDTCLNVGPDFRGRCKSPCLAGKSGGGADAGDKGGNSIRGSNRLGFWM
ncbi:hypothetical protein NW762_011222 [Fusarium torreyae]|uniref:Filamentous hemagglutinin n=1 Tax=Fusarium torreyae TaxID=1237075 RepID=A0A9W8RTQ5_9HYPO|nr:hypothetical protein NW762_011222 [Fusarium torreyae]